MQRTADVHDQITHPRLPQAAGVVDDATALDAAVDLLDTDTAAGDAPIRRCLRTGEGPAPPLAGRHEDVDRVQGTCQEPESLKEPTARGPGIGARLGNPLIVGAAGVRLPQQEAHECGVDPPHIVARVALVLAAITARRLRRRLGALEAPFGAIRPTRGQAGTWTGAAAGGAEPFGGPALGLTMAAASAAATDRLGASPRVRRVARRTTHRL
jgi:hypothetical protein